MAKKQEIIKLPDHDPLKPVDLTKLGSNQDPCFGKCYDLSTKECKLCGDSELCAIKMAQVLKITRKELEEKNNYKDIDVLEDIKGIKKYIRSMKRKGLKRKEIITKASEKFEVPIESIKNIYKELKADSNG